MNSNELVRNLSERLSVSQERSREFYTVFVDFLLQELETEGSANFLSFGTFEVKKKEQRVMINPGTREGMLVPPRLVVAFKSSIKFKERLKML